MARMKSSLTTILTAIALLGSFLPRESGATAAAPDLPTARQQFEAARAGSRDATEQAQRLFDRLLRGDRGNPLYLAYYGSTFTLQGRDSHVPWTKIKLINQGVAILDSALAALERPAARLRLGALDLETRLIAIATFVALPEPLFHHFGAAKRQFGAALASPDFASAPADLRGRLFYEGALIARQERDNDGERSALRRVQALAPANVDMAEVRARLAALGDRQ